MRKTIIPFWTSHSSGIGSSDTELHDLCSDTAEWITGKRFGSDASEDEVMQWVNGLKIKVPLDFVHYMWYKCACDKFCTNIVCTHRQKSRDSP